MDDQAPRRTRRRFLVAGAAVLSGCGGDVVGRPRDASESTAEPIGTDVPSFQYDDRNTGQTDAGPESEPRRRLRAEIDGAYRAPPAIADGVAYFGGIGGVLRAVATDTGDVLWSASPDGGGEFEGTRRTPTVADGVVYYTTEVGTVVARTTDGTRLWTVEADGPADPGEASARRVYGSDPVVGDGRVFVNAGDGVYALDARTGAVRWKIPVVTVSPGTPALADGAVYFTRPDGYVVAAETASGEPLWSSRQPGVYPGAPAVEGETVYIPAEGGPSVVALDTEDGGERWTFDAGAELAAPVAVAGGTVYASAGGTLYALDAADGTERWSRDLGEGVRSVGPPTVADGTVYLAARVREQLGSRLLAVDADGGERWSVGIDVAPDAGPVVADGRVLLVEDFTFAVYG
jgi:outer membrane protein assembly factor BamB